MITAKEIFNRTELLLGKQAMQNIASKRVIVFGAGGVGSWCAESLIRSGIGQLTIVDFDFVCATNINRQLMATVKNAGKVKVEALKERLLEINPEAEITALQKTYSHETAESFRLDSYDYIIDAIDSIEHKTDLIQTATRTGAVFFSSMGAALKTDSSKIRIAEFWQVQGCPLARALRSRLKKTGLPAKKFLCIYSDELLKNKGENHDLNTENNTKKQINGTVVHITAIFGFMLAGLVINDTVKNT